MLSENVNLNLSVSEFVSLVNQTFDFAFPELTITGELANIRISKNKWLYFDLKDETATVKFFGTVYMLPGPLEEGMLVRVHGTPKLHNQYGFSVTVRSIQPSGEGTIRRAAALLQAKLQAEGLFSTERKRVLPFPPKSIGLVASEQSAAYADFMKILAARWSGLRIYHVDVQVQGDVAVKQIITAIEKLNGLPTLPDVIVLIRGGGSPEDLAAFSTEQVTRAVAASRIPTLVAIGHETDTSLAELAADQRASTPSNAAELIVPDKASVAKELGDKRKQLSALASTLIRTNRQELSRNTQLIVDQTKRLIRNDQQKLLLANTLLNVLNPATILKRGYAIIRQDNQVIRSINAYTPKLPLVITVCDGTFAVNELGNLREGKK